MNATKTPLKDPICGMTVNAATALKVERSGKTFYFCSEQCKKQFLAGPVVVTSKDKPCCK